MERRNRLWRLNPDQLGLRQLGKERVIAVPGAGVVQRREEEPALLDRLQQLLRLGPGRRLASTRHRRT
ncbi:MAG: hypothetical protein HGA45_23595 [Chloroflexales bacterium]|nr:hypothetical protein [Chloroflexales bacterium]